MYIIIYALYSCAFYTFFLTFCLYPCGIAVHISIATHPHKIYIKPIHKHTHSVSLVKVFIPWLSYVYSFHMPSIHIYTLIHYKRHVLSGVGKEKAQSKFDEINDFSGCGKNIFLIFYFDFEKKNVLKFFLSSLTDILQPSSK